MVSAGMNGMGSAMARMEARVNLRLATETYTPYVKLAKLLTDTGIPMSATQLLRMLVEAQVEQTELLVTFGEAAVRGDRAAARKMWDAVMEWNQAELNVARAAGEVEGFPSATG